MHDLCMHSSRSVPFVNSDLTLVPNMRGGSFRTGRPFFFFFGKTYLTKTYTETIVEKYETIEHFAQALNAYRPKEKPNT